MYTRGLIALLIATIASGVVRAQSSSVVEPTTTSQDIVSYVTVTVGCGGPRPTVSDDLQPCVELCDTVAAEQSFLALHVLERLESEACRVPVFVHGDALLEHVCRDVYGVTPASTENAAPTQIVPANGYEYDGEQALPKQKALFAGSDINLNVANKSLHVLHWLVNVSHTFGDELPFDFFSRISEKVTSEDAAKALACLANPNAECPESIQIRAKRAADEPVSDIVPAEPEVVSEPKVVNATTATETNLIQPTFYSLGAAPAPASNSSESKDQPDLLPCNAVAARDAEWEAFATILAETGGFGNAALFLRALISRYERKARLMKGNDDLPIRFGEARNIINQLCRKITKREEKAVLSRVLEYARVHRAYDVAYIGEADASDIIVEEEYYPSSADSALPAPKLSASSAVNGSPVKSSTASTITATSSATLTQAQGKATETSDAPNDNVDNGGDASAQNAASRLSIPSARILQMIRKALRRAY